MWRQLLPETRCKNCGYTIKTGDIFCRICARGRFRLLHFKKYQVAVAGVLLPFLLWGGGVMAKNVAQSAAEAIAAARERTHTTTATRLAPATIEAPISEADEEPPSTPTAEFASVSPTYTPRTEQDEGLADGTPESSSPFPRSRQSAMPRGGSVEQFLVPSASFMMGSEAGDADERPVHLVVLEEFWIDRTEVTNAQYQACVADGECAAPLERSSYSVSDYYTNQSYAAYPVVHVTWEMADNFCEWRGGRLPTEAEWEYAAIGRSGALYPWGNALAGDKANFCDAACSSNFSWRDISIKDGEAEIGPVGSYPAGASWVGALDMAGNVYEWVFDWYDEGFYAVSPDENPAGPASGTEHVLRGGSWFDRAEFLRSANRVAFPAGGSGDNIGFRCVDARSSPIASVNPPVIATATDVPPTRPANTPVPTAEPTAVVPTPTEPPAVSIACQQEPGARWGPTLWNAHKERLGCALNQEARVNAAYQYFQHGMAVWRQDANRIYILYNNGSYSSYPDLSPPGHRESDLIKGGFGYLWNENATVRNGLGNPLAIEFNATDFAVQDFAGGTIFYFFENDAHNYVLFADTGQWKSTQE